MNHDQEQKRNSNPKQEMGTGMSANLQRGQAGGAPEFEPGDMIAGRYKVLSLVGCGATGSVYAVEQVFMKKRFALKTLSSIVASEVSQRRFQKEAQAAGKLDHLNLVRAVDFGNVDDGRLFLVMDFVAGQTLAQHLKEVGRLSVDEALRIFIPVCFGMEFAHEQGVIHRDIKPSNIVLERGDGQTLVPKIVDFGIAKLAEDAETESLTRTGEIFGTPLYMSPEQCSGIKVDHRSDIYSLGCVLYESLTGAPPFCGQTALETMMQHRTEPVQPLAEASFGLSFPPALEQIVLKMLAKEPENRYSSWLRLADDLILLQRGEPISASDISSSSSISNTKIAPKRQQLSRLYLYLLIIPVIALIAVPIYIFHTTQQQKPVADNNAAKPADNNGASEPSNSAAKPADNNASEANNDASPDLPGRATALFCLQGDMEHGRVFHFGERPNDPTFTFGSGILYSSSSPSGGEIRNQQAAKGIISVPPGAYVQFQPTLNFTVDHPLLFRSFKAGDIQRLKFVMTEWVDADPVSFNAAMPYVGGVKDLKGLEFGSTPLNSDGLAGLKLDGMPSLTDLSLVDTQVDGNDLKIVNLRKLKVLQFSTGKNASGLLRTLKVQWHNSEPTAKVIHTLFLRGDKLTDDDLKIIAEFDIDFLNISGNPALTNAGLTHLQKQKSLQILVLDGNQFDPSAVQKLARKINLKLLQLGKVKHEQKEQWRRSLAPCKVEFDDSE